MTVDLIKGLSDKLTEAQVGATYEIRGVRVTAMEGRCGNHCALVDDIRACLDSPGCMGKYFKKVDV